jgi:hypothetical protein
MAADDVWDLAAIDPNLRPAKQADSASLVGMKAAVRVADAKAKASAANEGGGSQPAEATQGVNEDVVMGDFVTVCYISILELWISYI